MPLATPEQSYFPGAKLRLILRFDELGADDAPEPPDRPPQLRTGKGSSGSKLAVVEQSGRLVLLGPGDLPTQQGGPQAQRTSDDLRTHAIEVLPWRLSISRNGIRTADTMSASVRRRDLPVDPRVVRACAVQAYVGTSTQEEHSVAALDGRGRIVPDEYVDENGASRTNLRFSGWVDEWETDFGHDDEALVNLECTDNARLLIEQEAPPKLAVSPSEPIHKAIAHYLSNFPQFRGLAVEYRPAGLEPPLLSSALGKTAYQPKLGPGPANSKLTVWDYLADICGAVGHIVTVDDVTVVVQRARTLYGSNFPARPDDPFVDRDVGPRVASRRLFVYGRNVLRPRFRRKFARFAPFGVEVRCYAPAKAKTLVARFPQKGQRPKRLLPGNAAEQSWRVLSVHGIETEEALRSIAQSVYESVGRNEIEVEFESKDLASYGAGPGDPDALDMRAGDAFDLEIVRDLEAPETIARGEAALRERPEAFMTALGFGADFARAYGEAIATAGLQTTFRLKTLAIDYEQKSETGVRLSFVGINYVEVRGDKVLPGGEEPEPTAAPGDSSETIFSSNF